LFSHRVHRDLEKNSFSLWQRDVRKRPSVVCGFAIRKTYLKGHDIKLGMSRRAYMLIRDIETSIMAWDILFLGEKM